MAAEYTLREFQPPQQETLERAVQVYRDYLDSLKASKRFKGGMHWKTIKGKQYLYRYRDRYGHGESLGPRSPETERLLAEFTQKRQNNAILLASRREHLAAAARFCRAALILKVPEAVIRIVHRLELNGMAGATVMVIGTQALRAFEFAAGVFIDTPKSSPFWSGAGAGLTLAAAKPVSPDDFLYLLRLTDRSFYLLPGNGCEAINKAGFSVKFIHPPSLRASTRPGNHGAAGLTVPAESGDLSALINSPRFSQVVIGKRGTPATMVVPDPRSMALHKLWLSQQADRAPAKKIQDRLQAMALAELIVRCLPQYDFFSSQLNLFPPEVARPAQRLVEGYEMSPDLDLE